MTVSIWSWGITEDLDALFSVLIAAPEDGFESTALPWAEAAPPDEVPDADEILSRTEAMVEGSKMPKTLKEGLLSALQNIRADKDGYEDEEEGEDEWEDEDGMENPLPTRREISLATSHMFYEDPYASLDYEEIDAQVEARIATYRAAASKALGQPGQSFFDFLGISEDIFENGEDLGALEVLLWQGFTWVWKTDDVIYYIANEHEDKELPIHIGFGRVAATDFNQNLANV